MSDIVELLTRELKKPGLIGGRVFAECKKEIERLRAENAKLREAAKVSAEPVAYGVNCSNTGRLCFLYDANDEEDMDEVESYGDLAFPLYTSPAISSVPSEILEGRKE